MALWIVATPIGTLSDCSPRAKRILSEATLIAAEDTRVTRRLLHALSIESPRVVSLRAKNEKQMVASLLTEADSGELVYVCDAGTPCISDPGSYLVEQALQAGIRVLSVPGPSSLSTALAASGFLATPSFFAGFAPKKGRENWLSDLLKRPETLVVFEAPTRILDLVRRCAAMTPDREASLCRELSKRHEEIIRGRFDELNNQLKNHSTLKGEMVLVIGPSESARSKGTSVALEGESLKDIAKVLAARWDISKRDAYQHLLDIGKQYEE